MMPRVQARRNHGQLGTVLDIEISPLVTSRPWNLHVADDGELDHTLDRAPRFIVLAVEMHGEAYPVAASVDAGDFSSHREIVVALDAHDAELYVSVQLHPNGRLEAAEQHQHTRTADVAQIQDEVDLGAADVNLSHERVAWMGAALGG